ncbi:MAG: prolipoprotein diacylglyceryl transferase [Myxococcales bacterium]|nr:prolipoprotein diacylglyceryl transferase [Myxococcales bacterium]
MGALLYIPWFKLGEWNVPLYALVGGILLASGFAALTKPEWREAARSWATFAIVGGAVAFFVGWTEVPIQTFGILVATGVVLGTRLAERQAMEWGIHPAYVADFATHVVVIGFISCYILNGVFYETETLLEILEDPSLLFKKWLGLSSFGGFIGAVLGIFVWKMRRKLPVSHLSDVVAWVFPFGWIFGRMGCFVVHDHPGAQTTFFLGIEGWEGQEGVIRHDLGLYEVFWSILVFSIFWSMRKMKNRPTGLFVALLPLFYTPYRFGLDFLRATDVSNPDTRFLGLTPGHYAAMGFFLFSLAFLMWVRRRGIVEIPPALRWPTESSVAAETEEERPKAEPSRSGKKVKRKRA